MNETEKRLYHDNEIDSHSDGGFFDVRFRIARSMLEGGVYSEVQDATAQAQLCLNAAESLVALAEAAGYIRPYPETGISTYLKRAIGRQGEFEEERAKIARKLQRDMQREAAVAGAGVMMPPNLKQ